MNLLPTGLFSKKGAHQNTMPSDNDLYHQLKIESQKEAAFRSLYDRYSESLFRFIYRFTLNRQNAEEILHDIFIQLLTDKYNPSEGHLKSWLFTLAKNKSLNCLKKASFETTNESVVTNAVSNTDLEQTFMYDDLLKNLTRVENKLPFDLQQTWKLRKQGFDYQEISRALSIPVGTVKSRFSRIVDYLKKEFQL